ncbi:NADP-dependent oxidoreductase domain-containing protein [Mycena metata]|uniref:NADP-dependent oxidoreductase domain-containing protein n=1 Tax=Mycena metata TaxID=1033252 RepID=A0AAD7NXK8_9AGAR|nr:NADP-dependent oxidoreductase domain-containing protein [Mycena metata]
MSNSSALKLVFGGAPISPNPNFGAYFPDEESIEKLYQLLEEGGVDAIDTACAYGSSEEWIGKTGGGKRFPVDSKTPGGFIPGSSTGESIPQHAKESVERTRVEKKAMPFFMILGYRKPFIHNPSAFNIENLDKQLGLGSLNAKFKHVYAALLCIVFQPVAVQSAFKWLKLDVLYIHAPDPSVLLEDQLQGVNTAYTAGYFKRFGLSNFSPADVQRVYDICKEKGYPLLGHQTANYSAVARKNEVVLFPLLRKLGIAVYVYSPIAGGLLTKTSAQVRTREGAGRYSKDAGALEALYGGLYNKPSYYTALDLWGEAANGAGCSGAELAYRWVAFDSAVDGKSWSMKRL